MKDLVEAACCETMADDGVAPNQIALLPGYMIIGPTKVTARGYKQERRGVL
jgi:hypothetical protein